MAEIAPRHLAAGRAGSAFVPLLRTHRRRARFQFAFLDRSGRTRRYHQCAAILRLQKDLRRGHGRLRFCHRGGGFFNLARSVVGLSANSQDEPFGRSNRMKRSAALLLCSFGIAVYCLLPFLWFVLTSFKTPTELTTIPPKLILSFHWGFYQSALEKYGVLHYIANSVIVAGAATLSTIAIGALATYAMARFHLGWTRFYLLLLLAISMFPQIAVAGPVWSILDRLDWLNTYQGLVAAYIAFSLPLAVWILTTFFREVPSEIEAAALVDGCRRLQALYKAILPPAAPAVYSGAPLVFIHPRTEP